RPIVHRAAICGGRGNTGSRDGRRAYRRTAHSGGIVRKRKAMATRRERLASFVLLPAGLAAVGILAYFTFRTTLQVERLRQQSVLEATLGLANEKADRLEKRIIEQDSVVFAIADPARLSDLASRW